MPGERYLTTDHATIRAWTAAREGWPSTVASGYRPGDAGLIRLDFPGSVHLEALRRITWNEWFATFDARHYVLLYQETLPSGEPSSFHRILSQGTAGGIEGAAWVGERRRAGAAPAASPADWLRRAA